MVAGEVWEEMTEGMQSCMMRELSDEGENVLTMHFAYSLSVVEKSNMWSCNWNTIVYLEKSSNCF